MSVGDSSPLFLGVSGILTGKAGILFGGIGMSVDMDWVEMGFEDGYSGEVPRDVSEIPIGKVDDYMLGYSEGCETAMEHASGSVRVSWDEGGW